MRLYLFIVYLISISAFLHSNYIKKSHNLVLNSAQYEYRVDVEDRLNVDSFGSDYIGIMDFCLQATDTPLSGPSITKALNIVTNEIMQTLLIGHVPSVNKMSNNFHILEDFIKNSIQKVDNDDSNKNNKDDNDNNNVEIVVKKDEALEYISNLKQLVCNGIVVDNNNEKKKNENKICDNSYNQLVKTLSAGGCDFPSNKAPVPNDSNICLSMTDLLTGSENTATSVLNRYSNCVSRAMIYGGSRERTALANVIDIEIPNFSKEYVKGNCDSQEVRYLKALVTFLRHGVAAAETATRYRGFQGSSNIVGLSSLDGYMDEMCKAAEIDIESKLCRIGQDEKEDLRLFDIYQTAFQRVVVDVCLAEMLPGMRRGRVDAEGVRLAGELEDADLLQNFVDWEASLRTNLTDSMWNPNPPELAGAWELTDVAGEGSLESIFGLPAEELQQEDSTRLGPKVMLQLDGKVDVHVKTGKGDRWYFRPGPAHLDTCEFFISSKETDQIQLRYTGFIDRGQRIEARFSRRPIRMTGRVEILKEGGDVTASSRFIMELKKIEQY